MLVCRPVGRRVGLTSLFAFMHADVSGVVQRLWLICIHTRIIYIGESLEKMKNTIVLCSPSFERLSTALQLPHSWATLQTWLKNNRFHSPMGKETLGVSRVRHGPRKPSKARVSGSRLGFSITAGIMESGLMIQGSEVWSSHALPSAGDHHWTWHTHTHTRNDTHVVSILQPHLSLYK